VRQLDLTTRCYAIDTWEGDTHAGYYGNEIFTRLDKLNQDQYAGFSQLMRERFDQAAPRFPDGVIDLLHIDGRHGYEDVLHDFTTWLPKLSERAVVLFHDTNVRERGFGVWRLWEELASRFPSFEFPHGHGLGVLGVGRDIPAPARPLFAREPDVVALIRAAYARLGAAVTNQALAMRAQSVINQLRSELAARDKG
jgi:Methyltransferase domain